MDFYVIQFLKSLLLPPGNIFILLLTSIFLFKVSVFYTREILKAENINTIFLVTKAWHLPRAVEIFKQQGFTVVPAPTGFSGFSPNQSGISFYRFIPSSYAIQTNYQALHEFLGRAWYFIRN